MKEGKPYPIIEEEDGSCLSAQEPTAGVAYAEDAVAVMKHIPGLPESWDELVECLKDGEQELERGEGIPWEVATQRIRSRISKYGS